MSITQVSNNMIAFDGGAMGFRNKLINGNFDYWQRGTSFTNPSAGYVADRWRLEQVSSAGTISQQAFTPGQTDVPGNPSYFIRLAQSGTGLYRLAQKIEAPMAFSGQQVTVTFYAKTPATATLAVFLAQDNFATGARTDTSIMAATSLTASWQKFTLTGTFPSITGKTIGANTYASVEFYLPNGTAATVDIAQVQLEFGASATPFEVRPVQVEYALCQRYLQRISCSAGSRFYGAAQATNNMQMTITLPVRMRIAPVPTTYNIGDLLVTDFVSSPVAATSATWGGMTVDGYGYCNIGLGSSPMTAGRAAMAYSNAGTAYTIFDAEF